MSMTTSPGKQLNKTIYSRLLAVLHLKVGRTARAYTSHCTWRQLKQTPLVDGALFEARCTGPQITSCFWTRLPVEPLLATHLAQWRSDGSLGMTWRFISVVTHLRGHDSSSLCTRSSRPSNKQRLPVMGPCWFILKRRSRVYNLLPHGGSMEWQYPTLPKIGRFSSIIIQKLMCGWKRNWLHNMIS